MRSILLDELACPVCHNALAFKGTTSEGRLSKGVLECINGHLYQVKDEIPILKDPKTDKNEFVWNVEFPNVKEYDEIRMKYASYLSEELRRADETMANDIVEAVSKRKLVLDIASGLGTLLIRLSRQTNEKTVLLGTDIDERPLRGAKLKLEEQKAYGNVSLCVMDAKHLAVARERIPCLTSFFGFDNIRETKKAFSEAHRVLEPKGQLAFASLWFKEDSKSLVEAEKLGFGIIATEEKLSQVLEETGFRIDSVKTYYSGEWPHNPMDLLPFEGDWFAHVLVLAHKK